MVQYYQNRVLSIADLERKCVNQSAQFVGLCISRQQQGRWSPSTTHPPVASLPHLLIDGQSDPPPPTNHTPPSHAGWRRRATGWVTACWSCWRSGTSSTSARRSSSASSRCVRVCVVCVLAMGVWGRSRWVRCVTQPFNQSIVLITTYTIYTHITQFVSSTVWKALFNKVADSLERSTENEDECTCVICIYMGMIHIHAVFFCAYEATTIRLTYTTQT